MSDNIAALVAEARGKYKSMAGVVVVSPKLLASLADALENSQTTAQADLIYQRKIEADLARAEATIEAARAVRDVQKERGVTTGTSEEIYSILAAHPTSSALNEIRAQAWAEGAVAEANRWVKVPVNPYTREAGL